MMRRGGFTELWDAINSGRLADLKVVVKGKMNRVTDIYRLTKYIKGRLFLTQFNEKWVDSYKADVAEAFLNVSAGELIPFEAGTPVGVSLVFILNKAKSVKRDWPCVERTGDVDNFEKGITDGLEKWAYYNDAQICEVHKFKVYEYETSDGKKVRPRVVVRLWELEGGFDAHKARIRAFLDPEKVVNFENGGTR